MKSRRLDRPMTLPYLPVSSFALSGESFSNNKSTSQSLRMKEQPIGRRKRPSTRISRTTLFTIPTCE